MATNTSNAAHPDSFANLVGLYLLIGFVLALAAYFLVLRPVQASIVDLGRQTSVQKTKLSDLDKLAVDTETLRGNFLKVSSKQDQIRSLLPKTSEEVNLLVLLNTIATQNAVALANFVPEGNAPLATKSTVEVYPVTINVAGSYANLQKFLAKLETAARFINVDKLSIGSVAATGVSGVSVNLSLNVYYHNLDNSGGVSNAK